VQRIAYTSIPSPSDSNPAFVVPDHRATELALLRSGVEFVSLRNANYIEILAASAPAAVASGTLLTNVGDGRAVHVARDFARAQGLRDAVVLVDTDSEEIAAEGRRWGAEVPFLRPAALADDHAETTSVVAHAVEALQADACSAVCCIYATAPFLRVEDLRRGAELLESGDWQYVFSATGYDAPVFRGFTERAGGGLQMLFPEHFRSRSQDLPEALHDAAQFYFGRPAAWRARARIFDAHSTVVRIPRERVQDIDTEEDWVRAELLFRAFVQEGGRG